MIPRSTTLCIKRDDMKNADIYKMEINEAETTFKGERLSIE